MRWTLAIAHGPRHSYRWHRWRSPDAKQDWQKQDWQ